MEEKMNAVDLMHLEHLGIGVGVSSSPSLDRVQAARYYHHLGQLRSSLL